MISILWFLTLNELIDEELRINKVYLLYTLLKKES